MEGQLSGRMVRMSGTLSFHLFAGNTSSTEQAQRIQRPRVLGHFLRSLATTTANTSLTPRPPLLPCFSTLPGMCPSCFLAVIVFARVLSRAVHRYHVMCFRRTRTCRSSAPL